MIGYKWVIKQGNKYYPLVNFGINCWMKIKAQPYEIGKTYTYNGEYTNLVSPIQKIRGREIDGFHFWKHIDNEILDRWNNFLQKQNQPLINATLLCKIGDIVNENNCNGNTRIIANKFTVLKEEENGR